MLRGMIKDEEDVRDTCNVGRHVLTFTGAVMTFEQERDGWYTTHALERIKAILRHKFFSLLEGHTATDEECARLFMQGPLPSSKQSTRKLRPGKHNMAKGALPPEDAAVSAEHAAESNA